MKILAVMVRYRIPLSESPALLGLCAALTTQPDLAGTYTVMVWDNSPEAISNPVLPIPFQYRHSQVNLGVSGAYNGAMEFALEHGYPWMLLLDQDTVLSEGFLRTMKRHGHNLENETEIAAIAPTVMVRGSIVSPWSQFFDRHTAYPRGQLGVAPGKAFAINSGCLIRTATLKELGGYSAAFWLDYSDIYVFHQLFERRKKIWLAADAELENDMSMMDYGRLMTPGRFSNFSLAETAFSDLYGCRLERFVQILRVFARAIKQRMKYKNPEFSRIAWRQFIYRLTVPREERIARWTAESRQRVAQQTLNIGEMPEATRR